MARALRAGHAFTTGLGIAAEELPAPVGAEFKRVYDRQNFGLPLPDALRELAPRVPLLDARFFVTAVLTQREAGGNLAEVLATLSSVIRDRFKVKRQSALSPRTAASRAGCSRSCRHCWGASSSYLPPPLHAHPDRRPAWACGSSMAAVALQLIGRLHHLAAGEESVSTPWSCS